MSEQGQERALGRIEAILDVVVQQQTALIADVARIQSQMAEKSQALAVAEAEVRSRLTDIEKTLREAQPAIQEMGVWKERGRGAIMLGAFLMASFGATVATFWAKLVNMVSGHS